MNNGYTVEVIASRASSLRDKAVSIGFHTKKELPPEQRALIMEYDGQEGWLLFKPNEVKEEEIPQQDADLERKTQSQRIRGSLYRLWESTGMIGKFEDYYREQTEKYILAIQSRIK